MQREIKFRGQRYDDKTWIYGSLLEDDIIVSKGATDVDESYIGFSDEWSSVVDETVGQYTGLKDKNGKEIYEGDVIKHPNSNLEKVVFVKGCFQTLSVNYPNANLSILDSYSHYIEVIGNIYENPELLNQEEFD